MSERLAFDPYAELGIRRDATPAQIKAAYRELTRTLHPDAGGGREDFDRLTRAYDVLKNPELRKAFDETGKVGERNINPLEVHALGAIARIVRAVLADDEEPYGADVVGSIAHMMEHEAGQISDAIRRLRRGIDRANKLTKKFKRRRPGNNVFPAMLAYEKGLLEMHLRQAEHDLKVRECAVGLLRDYEFDYDKMIAFFEQRGMSPSPTPAW